MGMCASAIGISASAGDNVDAGQLVHDSSSGDNAVGTAAIRRSIIYNVHASPSMEDDVSARDFAKL